MTKTSQTPMLWNPADHAPERSNLAAFIKMLGQHHGHTPEGYEAFNHWAVRNMEEFWSALWDFAGIKGDKGKTILEKTLDVPWARFFADSKINYTENIFAHLEDNPGAPAIISRVQGEASLTLTWRELSNRVSMWQQALERAGITEGDRVAAYLPNIPDTVILFLAAANIGAVFSSAGMEMGASDLINRLGQVSPKILVAADGYLYGSKPISRLDIIARAKKEIPGLKNIILLDFLPEQSGETIPGVIKAIDFLKDIKPRPLTFTRRDFNHPLYVLFSSGSTGKPKCFEHSTGGVLLKHAGEQLLNCDIRPGDVVFYHATPSWMMWNWLVGALATGVTILLHEGSPSYPDVAAQWNFTAAHKCTHHGTAAPVILGWEKNNLDLTKTHDLVPLRMILSTGAVLPAQGFTYIHNHIKRDVKIASISGGTDIVGCFLGGNPFTPTYASQVNGPMLGIDLHVLDDQGKDAASGELVCANPFPSMPLRFFDDRGGTRYRAEYFDYYEDKHVWRHGDSIEKTSQGQYIIIGRSDATLNQNGVRIGTAAIYDQLTPFKEKITDAAAVDFTRPDNKQAITILFLATGEDTVNADLAANIRSAIKNNVTPFAVPSEIIGVPGILKTPNGKKAEVVMKKLINGGSIPNASLYGEDLVKFYEDFGKTLKQKYGG